MVLTPAIEQSLSPEQGCWLLGCARYTIAQRLGVALPPPSTPDLLLQEPAACFVTLTLDGQLRGCIGTLTAERPLAEAVAYYAAAAAFEDPRFPPLTLPEWPSVAVEVSVLSAAVPVQAESEEALLAQLQPGVHGLIIERGAQRATFLPQVWESLPEPAQFLGQLKRKAGLDDSCPVAQLRCSIYTVNYFAE
ncbi:MAG TPA: AmmeMemoRadiSam system protein A [Motiliproteus sp.]